jgi:hypothetical protein
VRLQEKGWRIKSEPRFRVTRHTLALAWVSARLAVLEADAVEETAHSLRLVRFGTFEVDLQAGELRKNGLKLKLSGQPFQVLAILLEHPGEVVTREELQKRLWPDTFVDVDHNLNTAIMSGFGSNPNDPKALWDPVLLADIRNSLTVMLMSIFLFGVMVLFISAFIIEVFKR